MDEKLLEVCKLLRYDILTATTAAGSGHPTSSLSAVELMATLFFGGFLHTNLDDPHDLHSDKLIFSKGHAAPLLYALYHAAGVLKYDELLKLRTFSSNLEGHPTPNFPYVDVTTGSLGQGLSIGVGMALGMKLNHDVASFDCRDVINRVSTTKKIRNRQTLDDNDTSYENTNVSQLPKVFVLLGDSELAEGQNWEAMQIASYYKLGNLVAILDMNRIGQRGETMEGWNADVYAKRAEAFGWEPVIVKDGHNIDEIYSTFKYVGTGRDLSLQKPVFIIAHTIKGKGVSFLENKDGWHGKALTPELLEKALKEIGKVDIKMRMEVQKRSENQNKSVSGHAQPREIGAKHLTDAENKHLSSHALDASPAESGISMTDDNKKTEVLDKLKSYFSP